MHFIMTDDVKIDKLVSGRIRRLNAAQEYDKGPFLCEQKTVG